MSTSRPKSATPITDKARKAALAEINARIGGTPTSTTVASEAAGKKGKAKSGTLAPRAKATNAPKEKKAKKVSCLDAAAKVIASASKPMRAKEMIAEMESKGLWKTPGGKTPEATLYASITREIAAKKDKARFKKVERGLFAAGKGA